MPTNYFLTTSTRHDRSIFRESFPPDLTGLHVSISLNVRVHGRNMHRARYLCAFIRDLTGSIGNIWRRRHLERGLGELSGTWIQNIGNLAAGMSASRRDAGAQTRKRKLGSYVESPDRSDCQVNPHRDSLTRHQPTTRYFALIYRYTIYTYCKLQNTYKKYPHYRHKAIRESIMFA